MFAWAKVSPMVGSENPTSLDGKVVAITGTLSIVIQLGIFIVWASFPFPVSIISNQYHGRRGTETGSATYALEFMSCKLYHALWISSSGANTGIGKETAADLYKRGATVIMLCRSEEKANAAINSINDEVRNSDGTLTFEQCDLSSMLSVRKCAERLLAYLIKGSSIYDVHKIPWFLDPLPPQPRNLSAPLSAFFVVIPFSHPLWTS